MKNSQTVIDIIFYNYTTFQKGLYLPQLKQWLISTIKNIVHELPYELPKDLRPGIVGYQ